MQRQEAKSVIEALIFISDNPLGPQDIKKVLEEFSEADICRIVKELNEEYLASNRSFIIQDVAGAFRMVTRPEFAPWLKEFYKTKVKERLTRPALETLAIIAYKQPVTKPEIEAIRGVNVDGVITTLLDRNLIRLAGRKDTVGRPLLYATTDEFLTHFGLNSISEMPKMPEVKQLTEAAPEHAAMEAAETEESKE